MSVHSFRQRPARAGQARADEPPTALPVPKASPPTSPADNDADADSGRAITAFTAPADPQPLGLTDQPTLSEAFAAHPLDGAAGAFVLAMLPPGGTVLWAQDRLSRREAGAPYLPGLSFIHPQLPDRPLLRIDLSRPTDVLAALEDGLGCPALGAVVGEIHGVAPSFTATRRLALRAERAGIACWLILHASAPQPSAARMRWRVSSAPSAAHPHDPMAPGAPRWQAELFRARTRPPATWLVGPQDGALKFTTLRSDTDVAAPPKRGIRHATSGA